MGRIRIALAAAALFGIAPLAGAQTTSAITGSTSASGTTPGLFSRLTSLFTGTPSVANSNVSTSSFSNASTNVSGVSQTPGLLTRLYRTITGSSNALGTYSATSNSYPAGQGQSNMLPLQGPLQPIMGTTTSFPVPTVNSPLVPVMPKSSTVGK